jgi:anti-anti-sigma factor
MEFQPLQTPLDEDNFKDTTVVHFTGLTKSLDEQTNRPVGDLLGVIAEEPSCSRMVIDLDNVSCVTSGGLGMLVSLHTKLLALGRRLCIHNPQPLVYEVFAITKLDGFLDLRTRVSRATPPTIIDRGFARAGLLVSCWGKERYAALLSRLRREGYKVLSWRNGQLAVEFGKEFPYSRSWPRSSNGPTHSRVELSTDDSAL